MGDGPKYPNQQLKSVSLETFFAGDLRTFSVAGDIQAAVRSHLPNLFVPNVEPGAPLALRPFQLRSSDNTRMLGLAINQVTYASFSYPGYNIFSGDALPLVSSALDAIKPARLNRVVYRYENEIGLGRREDGSLGIEQYFPALVPALLSSGPCRTLDSAYEQVWQDERHRGARGFHARVEDVSGLTTFRLAVFGSVESCALADLSQAVATAHSVAVELFEASISQDFREFISSVHEVE